MDIYKITNLITNKCYVGFSKNAAKRFKRHLTLAENGVNRRLYDSIRKHGKENFILEIIATCVTKEEAVELEKFWISELNSLMPNGYNMTVGGDGGNTLVGWTEEEKKELYTRQANTRIGMKHTEETKEKISKAHLGKTMPEEQKLRLSETLKKIGHKPPTIKGKIPWMKGKKHTEESLKKISSARLGKSYEDLWDISYIEERKAKLRENFSGENNPLYVEFTVFDKLKVLKYISKNIKFRLKDSHKTFGFSEFKIRELLREIGITNFHTERKNNRQNWEHFIENLSMNLLKDEFAVDSILGIQKWEAPIPACLAGQMRGNFPSAVKKTEAERVQNLNRSIEQWKQAGYTFTVMEKIDGSSSTFYLDQENDFHVCSRNWDLKDEGENTYWNMAKKYSIQEKMIANNMQGLAIQGEVWGNQLNNNLYKSHTQDLAIFSIYDTKTSSYIPTMEAKKIADKLELKFVPIIGQCNDLPTIDRMLNLAEFNSYLNHSVKAEGHVYRCNEDPNICFKAISNLYLLNKKGD